MTTRTRHLIKEEEAVSPVIGVILMVAITVILAAVIGAFVFGMGGSLSKTYSVAATATQVDSTTIHITFQGGPDADLINHLNVTVDGVFYDVSTVANGARWVPSISDPTAPTLSNPSTGDVISCSDSTDTDDPISSGRDHVIVTATFEDGIKQVILDTYV